MEVFTLNEIKFGKNDIFPVGSLLKIARYTISKCIQFIVAVMKIYLGVLSLRTPILKVPLSQGPS